MGLLAKMPGVKQAYQPVFIKRNDPVHPVDHAPAGTMFYQPDVQYEQAPLPLPETMFYGYGRDALHAPTPIARFMSLNIAEILSHVGWPFGIRTDPVQLRVNMPHGTFVPIRERVTLTMPRQTTVSDQSTVQAVGGTTPTLAKITS